MKKFLLGAIALALVGIALLMFLPKTQPSARLKIDKGQNFNQVAQTLDKDRRIWSLAFFWLAAKIMPATASLKPGIYQLGPKASTYAILRRLRNGRPDSISIRAPEGVTFRQFRAIIDGQSELRHDARNLSEAELLKAIDPELTGPAEGWFFPATYEAANGSSDLDLYKQAHALMQRRLKEAWEDRQSGLPVQSPYELLTLASLIEKETADAGDRTNVAAVFVNRLRKNMRLQTDPAVMYGLNKFSGNLTKADLQRDTPYNTYTRAGLTPTPICLPGKEALEAAAHPSNADYLYFVSRMDGTGKSQFSATLDEHNQAVNQYIRRKNQ